MPRRNGTRHQSPDSTPRATPVIADQVRRRPLAELRENPRNARTHSRQQISALADIIREFGFVGHIVTDADGQILAGHGRLAAARQLGLTEVPTIQVGHLTPAQQRAYVLADNKVAEMAGWDRDLLRLEIEGLAELDFDLPLTGFSVPEIESILDPGADAPEDAPPAPEPGPAVSRPGDLWLLGEHRLLCGSALEADAYAALMGEERAGVVFADPPYNVHLAGHVSGRSGVREFAMASGEMSREAFTAFLRTTFGHLAAFSIDGAVHFQCIDWRHTREMQDAAEGIYEQINLAVWAKTNAGMGSLYRSQHELVYVYRSGKGPHRNNVELGRHGRNRSNLWTYAGQSSFHRHRAADLDAHPTVKPLALVADALRDVSVRGDVVLDPFSGSGTTILAAERTRRRGRAIELDPVYVDVGVRRYEAATGQVARLAATGWTFAEVAEARKAERAAANDAGVSSHGEAGHAA